MNADVILIGTGLVGLAGARGGGEGVTLVPLLVWALLLSGPAGAEAVYKSVDADGRVTYSMEAPAAAPGSAVQELQIRTRPTPATPGAAGPGQTPPPPTAGQPARPSKDDVKQAQQALIQAKAELEQAKIHAAEDWQNTPEGDRVSTPEYDRRVAAAQAKVRAAETALAGVRGP